MLSTGCRGLQSALEASPDLLTAGVFSFRAPSRHHLRLTPTIRENKVK